MIFCVVNFLADKWKEERIMVIVCRWWIQKNIWSETALVICWNGRTLFSCCQHAKV